MTDKERAKRTTAQVQAARTLLEDIDYQIARAHGPDAIFRRAVLSILAESGYGPVEFEQLVAHWAVMHRSGNSSPQQSRANLFAALNNPNHLSAKNTARVGQVLGCDEMVVTVQFIKRDENGKATKTHQAAVTMELLANMSDEADAVADGD